MKEGALVAMATPEELMRRTRTATLEDAFLITIKGGAAGLQPAEAVA